MAVTISETVHSEMSRNSSKTISEIQYNFCTECLTLKEIQQWQSCWPYFAHWRGEMVTVMWQVSRSPSHLLLCRDHRALPLLPPFAEGAVDSNILSLILFKNFKLVLLLSVLFFFFTKAAQAIHINYTYLCTRDSKWPSLTAFQLAKYYILE